MGMTTVDLLQAPWALYHGSQQFYSLNVCHNTKKVKNHWASYIMRVAGNLKIQGEDSLQGTRNCLTYLDIQPKRAWLFECPQLLREWTRTSTFLRLKMTGTCTRTQIYQASGEPCAVERLRCVIGIQVFCWHSSPCCKITPHIKLVICS